MRPVGRSIDICLRRAREPQQRGKGAKRARRGSSQVHGGYPTLNDLKGKEGRESDTGGGGGGRGDEQDDLFPSGALGRSVDRAGFCLARLALFTRALPAP